MKNGVTPGQRPLKPVRGRLQRRARGANIPHGAGLPSARAQGSAPARANRSIRLSRPGAPPCGAAGPDPRSAHPAAGSAACTARSRPGHPRPGFLQEGPTRSARPCTTPPATAQRRPPPSMRAVPMRPTSTRQAIPQILPSTPAPALHRARPNALMSGTGPPERGNAKGERSRRTATQNPRHAAGAGGQRPQRAPRQLRRAGTPACRWCHQSRSCS